MWHYSFLFQFTTMIFGFFWSFFSFLVSLLGCYMLKRWPYSLLPLWKAAQWSWFYIRPLEKYSENPLPKKKEIQFHEIFVMMTKNKLFKIINNKLFLLFIIFFCNNNEKFREIGNTKSTVILVLHQAFGTPSQKNSRPGGIRDI